MAIDKSLVSGSTTMLLLKLLEDKDMYGYQMIEELSQKSNDTFTLKAGTLYPLLHSLEQHGMVSSYDSIADSAKVRKYYCLTKKGKGLLADKKLEWQTYTSAVNQVLQGAKPAKEAASMRSSSAVNQVLLGGVALAPGY